MKRFICIFMAALMLITIFPSAVFAAAYVDGTYTGTAAGYTGKDYENNNGSMGAYVDMNETVQASVTVKNGVITSIETEHLNNNGYFAPTFIQNAKAVISNILTKQSTEVDTISGATSTSKGIIHAVEAALEKAKEGEGLAEGGYTVPISVYKESSDETSMAAGAVVSPAFLDVANKKSTLTIELQPMVISGLTGYTTNLHYFKSAEDYEAYKAGDTSKLVTAKILSTYTVDGVEYAGKVSLELDNNDIYIYIALDADVGGSPFMVKQLARLRVNYAGMAARIDAAEVVLPASEIGINVQETLKVAASVLPETTTDKSLQWSSSDPSVFTVDANGTVTGVSAGSAVLTVKAASGVSATANITVKEAGMTYEKNGEGTATLTGATEGSTAVIVPEKVEISGDEYTVTKIKAGAFKGWNSVRELVLPGTITEIGKEAFYGTSLESVVLPDSVTTVGESAFANNIKLSSIQFSKNLSSLGEGAFEGDTALTEAVLPDSLTILEDKVFKGNSALKSVTLPASLISIGDESFYGASSLTAVAFPSTLESIGKSAFRNNYVLNNLSFPESLISIGERAFARNTALISLEFQGSLPSIGKEAFLKSSESAVTLVPSGLKTVYEEGLQAAGYNGAVEEGGITYVLNEGTKTAQVAGYQGTLKVANIPETIQRNGETYTVTSMAERAFYEAADLQSVSLPGTIETIPAYAFGNCSNLESAVIGEGTVTLGGQVFLSCSKLKNVSLPSTLKKITGQSTFMGCTSIEELVLPEGLESIDGQTFYNMSSLKSLRIPDGVTTLNGSNMFRGCSSLEEIILPKNLTALGSYAFASCSSLKKIEIPASTVLSSASYLFRYCTSLEEVIFKGATPKALGTSSFRYTEASLTVTVPAGSSAAYATVLANAQFVGTLREADAIALTYEVDGESAVVSGYTGLIETAAIPSTVEISGVTYPVTKIKAEAFKNASSLEEVIIPESITNIGANAFEGCGSLSLITFNGSTAPAFDGGNVFAGVPESADANVSDAGYENYLSKLLASGFKGSVHGTYWYTVTDGKAELAGYRGSDSEVVIPKSVVIDGTTYSVTSIGKEVFRNNTTLKKITIPDSVKKIKDSAFYGCTALSEITIPDSVTSIGDYAFYGCKKLTSIVIPDSVVSMGTAVFQENTSLTEVTLSKSLTEIPSYAFYGCTKLSGIQFPKEIKSIGDYAFQNCNAISGITLPDSLITIGNYAFYGISNTGLVSVDIPENVKSIGNYAFASQRYLKTVTLPEGLESIGNYAFAGTNSTYPGIASINLPDSLQSIGTYAFQYSTLTEVTWPSGIKTIPDYVFSYSTKLEKVIIPDGVTTISIGAFNQCTSLTEVNIPDGVTAIGNAAFSDCSSLKEIIIPDTVTTMGQYQFRNCKKLESVTLSKNLTEITNSFFVNCILLKKVTIPASVTSVGMLAFSGMTALEQVTFESAAAPKFGTSGGFTGTGSSLIVSVASGTKVDYVDKLASQSFTGTVIIEAKNISMDQGDKSIVKNQSLSLSATVMPEDADDKTITWTSSDESVAEIVDNSSVKGLKAGNVTITAMAASGVTKSFKLYVTDSEVAVSSIKIKAEDQSIEAGGSTNLSTEFTPSNATNRTVTWESLNTDIATVDAATGVVTGVKAGTAVIKATASGGATAQIEITVKVKALEDGLYLVPISMLKETDDSLSMANGVLDSQALVEVKGDSMTIYPTFKGLVIGTITGHMTSGGYFLTKEGYEAYKSGDTSQRKALEVLSYYQDGGKYYPANTALTVPLSTDTIYLQMAVDAMGGNTVARLSLDYENAALIERVSPESIQINEGDLNLVEEDKAALTVSYMPENTTFKGNLEWESDDSSIVSVNEKTGEITAKSEGTTTIQAYTSENLMAQIQVTVISKKQNEANKAAFQLVEDINGLPDAESIQASNVGQIKNDVEEILEKYNALNDTAKALVGNFSKLEPLQSRIAVVEQEVKLAGDLDKEIADLPKSEEIMASNVTAVKEITQSIRERYNAFNDTTKALVTGLDSLTSAEERVAQVEQEVALAKELDQRIETLPDVEEIQASNLTAVKEAVSAIREEYNTFNEDTKALVTKLTILVSVEAKIVEFEGELNLADELMKKISGLPAAEGINYFNAAEVKKTIAAIREEYAALKNATKELVTNYGTMDALSDKIAKVEASMEEGDKVVSAIKEVSDFDKDTTAEEWMEIVQQAGEIEEAFSSLDSDGKGVASESFNKLIAQIKAINQETDDITVSGLDWHYKVVTGANIAETHDKAKKAAETAGRNLLAVLDITIIDLRDNSEVTQLPGNITVTIKAEGDWSVYDSDTITVLHYKDGELIEELKGTYNGNGTISFETDSFSTYAVTAAVKADAASTPGTSDTGSASGKTSGTAAAKTGDTQPYWPIAASLLSLVVAVGALRKRVVRSKR